MEEEKDKSVTINIDKIEVGKGEVDIKPRMVPEAGDGEEITIKKTKKEKNKKAQWIYDLVK